MFRQVEALRDLRLNAQAGRIQLSLTALDAAGIDTVDLSNTPWPQSLQAFLQSTRIALQAQLSQTVASIRGPDCATLRALLVQAHLYVRLLDRIGEQIPASKPVHPQLRPLEKLIVSWRAARSAR
jgi:phytoene/squalene synthetase